MSISTILISSLLLACNYVQILAHDISQRVDRDTNLWIAPSLLLQWIAAAGNNRWDHEWDGFTIVEGMAFVKSDIDGSAGFPDHELSSSYEDIALSLREESLSIRSGSGFFQPVLRRILTFETERQGEDLLVLRWSGETDHTLKTTGARDLVSTEMKIHLWNYRENLFSEASH